jgi:hypothetical protein
MTCERRGTGKQIEHLFGLAEELRGVFLCHRLFPPYVVRRLNAGQPSESVFLNNKGRSVGGEGDLVRNFPHHSPCCYWNHYSFSEEGAEFSAVPAVRIGSWTRNSLMGLRHTGLRCKHFLSVYCGLRHDLRVLLTAKSIGRPNYSRFLLGG